MKLSSYSRAQCVNHLLINYGPHRPNTGTDDLATLNNLADSIATTPEMFIKYNNNKLWCGQMIKTSRECHIKNLISKLVK